MLHYKIKVTGKVQGVWFRKFTSEKAIELGLTGFVINKPDGSVYIEAVGTNEVLTELIIWLKTSGSPLSKVDKVTFSQNEAKENFTSFTIEKK